MATKIVLRQLTDLFAPPVASKSPSPTFPHLSLPEETQRLLDDHLSHFAASFPLGGGGGHQRDVEGERERSRWRDGLGEIWASVEPLPGTEGEPQVIARVSAFLVLLDQLSSGVGEDDDSALVSRKDIGAVWWGAVLRRTMLGTPKDDRGVPAVVEKARGRKATPKWAKDSPPAAPTSMRPLTVSRAALASATRMMSWGMEPPATAIVSPRNAMTAFGTTVWEEYTERATAMVKGVDEGYGVRNLEECIIGWAEKWPETFFVQLEPCIAYSSPSRLPFLSLLLAFLTRHPAKSQHALVTKLLPKINKLCLLSPSPALVTLATKCLVIFLVTLPVIIGQEALVGIFAVYGRIVVWDRLGDEELAPDQEQDQPFDPNSDGALDDPPPDPLILFTVLYGTYPCNFTEFLKDPQGYLQSKGWQGPRGDGDITQDWAGIKDRSAPLIRQHALHPALFTSTLDNELNDKERWARLEAADVMAECDRNLVQVAQSLDIRDPHTQAEGLEAATRPVPPRLLSVSGLGLVEHPSPSPSRQLSVSEEPERARNATPRPARSPSSPSPPSSRSRSRTPLMPHTTHFTNFQALQSTSNSMSPRRPSSPFARQRDSSLASEPASTTSSASTSRRSSYVGPASILASMAGKQSESLAAASATTGQLERLETELLVLRGEVNFQGYLKQLHLAHMGTLHREKVLDSGAEAERQSLYRTIRTLRGQLKTTQNNLDQLRAEASVTKANWILHIDELREKLRKLREEKIKWGTEGERLRAQVAEFEGLVAKQREEMEAEGAALFDLQNQVTVDQVKLKRIEEYEARIEALTKTLSICDEDLCKFTEQRKDMDALVGEWKKSELLREASEAEVEELKAVVRRQEDELVKMRNLVDSGGHVQGPIGVKAE